MVQHLRCVCLFSTWFVLSSSSRQFLTVRAYKSTYSSPLRGAFSSLFFLHKVHSPFQKTPDQASETPDPRGPTISCNHLVQDFGLLQYRSLAGAPPPPCAPHLHALLVVKRRLDVLLEPLVHPPHLLVAQLVHRGARPLAQRHHPTGDVVCLAEGHALAHEVVGHVGSRPRRSPARTGPARRASFRAVRPAWTARPRQSECCRRPS